MGATMRQAIKKREERAKLVTDARAMFDKADKEKRALSAEEEAIYDKIDEEIRALTKEVERLETLESLEADQARSTDRSRPRNKPDDSDGAELDPDGEPVGIRGRKAYRKAYTSYLRHGHAHMGRDSIKTLREGRAMQVGDDAEGGYLVPDEFNRQIILKLADENVFRQPGLATVLTSSSGTMEIAAENTRGAAAWTAEEAAYNESDDALAQVTLGAHKATRIIKVSEELAADSAFPIEGFLGSSFARSFGDLEETAFFVGTGSGQPTGIVPSAGVGVTAASATVVTSDEIIDLYHSLKRVYRKRASFSMSDLSLKAVRQLKDSGSPGQYMWQPGLQANEPDLLLGRPVFTSDDMPAMTAGLRAFLFADFSFYWIADRATRQFKRLDELYAANGQIGFAAMQRVDGKLTIAEAAKVLLML